MSITKKEADRATYLLYKQHGICVTCHCREAAIGFASCPDCLYKKLKYSRRPENTARTVEHTRARREKYRQEGRCADCGSELQAGSPYRRCQRCRKINARRTKRYREKQKLKRPVKPEGICRWCDKPVIPGKQCCEKHYAVTLENLARANAKRNSQIHPWNQYNKILFYGGGGSRIHR